MCMDMNISETDQTSFQPITQRPRSDIEIYYMTKMAKEDCYIEVKLKK